MRGTVAELDTAIPSTRWFQRCIRDKIELSVTTATGAVLRGSVRWQDPEFLCLACEGKEVLILRLAIAIISPA